MFEQSDFTRVKIVSSRWGCLEAETSSFTVSKLMKLCLDRLPRHSRVEWSNVYSGLVQFHSQTRRDKKDEQWLLQEFITHLS